MTPAQFKRAMIATGPEGDNGRRERRFYLKGDAQFFEGRADANAELAADMLVRVCQSNGQPVVIDIIEIAAIELPP